jgi:hypothetical protein
MRAPSPCLTNPPPLTPSRSATKVRRFCAEHRLLLLDDAGEFRRRYSDDFIEQVDDIITVGEFYHLAAGGQIIFT